MDGHNQQYKVLYSTCPLRVKAAFSFQGSFHPPRVDKGVYKSLREGFMCDHAGVERTERVLRCTTNGVDKCNLCDHRHVAFASLLNFPFDWRAFRRATTRAIYMYARYHHGCAESLVIQVSYVGTLTRVSLARSRWCPARPRPVWLSP